MPVTYQTADQLKITQAEYDGLLWVLESLRNGTLQERPADAEKPGSGKFIDMSVEYDEPSCGTTACIGGWVAVHNGLRGRAINDYVDDLIDKYEDPLYKLYWQNVYGASGPKQVAQAIDNFLRYGDPRWDDADPGWRPRGYEP